MEMVILYLLTIVELNKCTFNLIRFRADGISCVKVVIAVQNNIGGFALPSIGTVTTRKATKFRDSILLMSLMNQIK